MKIWEKFTEEEQDALIVWVSKMVQFWIISGLAYVAIFYQSTLAAWILGSIVVLEVWDWYKEKHQNEDNRHEATK